MQIWSTKQQPISVLEVDVKANVCCAKYNPGSSYEIAVGAADHTVLTYDLRKSDRSVHTYLRGRLLYILSTHWLTHSHRNLPAGYDRQHLSTSIISWFSKQCYVSTSAACSWY